ncbi:MAG: aminotransferase class III-fold pyridoxal phosphate-dependent enzyme, partial [Desulfobacterales bacterium]|nr:aminotransferase class III-fold pyridoxal phosphate-dependent enzyme [Desulfobacterales bacterium]
MEPSRDELIELYSRHVSPGKVDAYRKYDVLLSPGERGGCYIHDRDGRRFMNCHCNGGVFNLGHRNPRVMDAVKKAMETVDIGNHHLAAGPRAMLAKMLADAMPDGLNQVVYGVGGGEAVDLAIKLARGVTGREEIVSAVGGYHGHTGLAMAAGAPKFKEKFRPAPRGFRQAVFNRMDALEAVVSGSTAAVI